jgi:hypothetical protein
MLASDAKRLRWMGIDLRAQWKRQMAVVVTYAGFFVLIALDMNDRWLVHPIRAYFFMILLTWLWQAVSPLRNGGGPVKNFEDLPARVIAKSVIVGSLDEWARYRYGVVGFEEASDEQKAYLLRTYRVGNYVVPARPVQKPFLDERERAERDSISRWALSEIARYLAFASGGVIALMSKRSMAPIEVAAIFWILCLLARTLPQAKVLWAEADPRNVEELRLATGEA